MMTYSDATEYLFNALPAFEKQGAGAYKPGLETVSCLAEAFGNPHHGLRTIHVAGTNGKGSTAHSLAAILSSAGYRTGLFTSPHLVDFRERIRIDGHMISTSEVVDFTERFLAEDSLRKLHPTFFELTTVMALEYFARHRVDVAVIEVGLGGRLDSTNIITPDLSIITNISLDHMALLGDTPAAIAAEKAGIIKPGVPVVVSRAEGEVREVFSRKAADAGSEISFACDRPLYRSATPAADGSGILYSDTPWGDLLGQLTGDCQPENTAGILQAVKTLTLIGYRIPAKAVAGGLQHVCRLTGLMGRWMRVSDSPLVICDTGHNPGGWQYLGPRLAAESRRLSSHNRRLQVVLGFVSDKLTGDIMRHLATLTDTDFWFVAPDSHRARPAADLATEAAAYGIAARCSSSVAEGYKKALAAAGEGGMVFVGGSTYVVAEVLKDILNGK